MNTTPESDRARLWQDAAEAAAILALDPLGLGGVWVRAGPGPVRGRWLRLVSALLAPDVPVRAVPLHVSTGALVGGLDAGRTLACGTRVIERGLLASERALILVLSMAERWSSAAVVPIARALDTREGLLERDGSSLRYRACVGVIALDESLPEDEHAPHALVDRLGIHLILPDAVPVTDEEPVAALHQRLRVGRQLLRRRRPTAELFETCTAVAERLGVRSVRAVLCMARVARSAAALGGRTSPDEADLGLAARLVMAARARAVAPESAAAQPDSEPGSRDQAPPERPPPAGDGAQAEASLEDRVVAAAQTVIPEQLLAADSRASRPSRGNSAAGSGVRQRTSLRGRQVGSVPGTPSQAGRLDVLATLTAAAPWQRLRQQRTRTAGSVSITRRDFRIKRFEQKSSCTTVFAVDASGSQALHRLAEAKGAVELLLRECYVRRDRVALLAFRGTGAELLLAPTRSLVRARRCLASLPGGGGTPLAHGIDTAVRLAESLRRGGDTPAVVLLTDGRANISRLGKPDRARAREDARGAARGLRDRGIATVVVDTSLHPSAETEVIARHAGARYVPLPHVGAEALARIASSVTSGRKR